MDARIVFFGSGEIAIPAFRRLIADGLVPLALVTQPDKPAGRHRELTPPPIKLAALEAGIPVLQPESVRDEASLAELRELAPDVIVVMAYGQILPKALIAIPRIACINLHASLLPRHRGASCLQAAIDEGDAETGVTVMHVVPKLDAGDIIHPLATPIGPEETGGSLHDRMADIAAEALAQAMPGILAGTATRTPQDGGRATYAPKLDREHGRIDWTWDAERLARRIRAYEPWPGTWTTFDNKRVKIFPARAGQGSTGEPGTVMVEEGEVRVSCGSGYLVLGDIQPDGSRRMPAEAWAKGLRTLPRFV
ncbi:methionyl-tRNA formyltransferase [Luteolibacter flavescens]|uniref:Methionyl-tRNA formyltransferase n=1 Tax=Luteolibacter flavescens TaxID=1859460 RepID=A0ABT3FJ29_9BACT|nr:methionyl-tRNA formyltransferase [Luteolibacter flavescens]MCW1883364.1 methionyl-tRNA formyltransferase [Luteolibacter flavescens]